MNRNARRTNEREQQRPDDERRGRRDQGVHRNLIEQFDQVGDRRVQFTPSANIALVKKVIEGMA